MQKQATIKELLAHIDSLTAEVRSLRAILQVALPANRCRGCHCDCPDTIYCDDCAKEAHCPHGQVVGDCSPCDIEGDLAFDSARERR